MKNNDKVTFKIVLTGFIKPGISMQEVEKNLIDLFHLEPMKIKLLLQGNPTVIKKNLTIDSIDKYQQGLDKTGVEFEIIANKIESLSENFGENNNCFSENKNLSECQNRLYKLKIKKFIIKIKYYFFEKINKIKKEVINLKLINIFKKYIVILILKLRRIKDEISLLETKKKYLLLFIIIIIAIGFLFINKHSSNELIEAKLALNKLRAATEVGVTYRNYQELIIDAKGKIDSAHATDDRLNAAIEIYIDAMKVWKFKNENDSAGIITSGTELGDELIFKYPSQLSIYPMDDGSKAGFAHMILEELWQKAGQQLNDYEK